MYVSANVFDASCHRWDDFAAAAIGGTVYHQSAWLRAVAQYLLQDVRLHLVTEAGCIRAGAIVLHSQRYGISMGKKPWATSYNGVLTNDDSDGRWSRELMSALASQYDYVRLVGPPGNSSGTFAKWTISPDHTPFLDISDLTALWNRFGRRVRQRVRKATELGIKIDEPHELDWFHELYWLTYGRQGLPMALTKHQICGVLHDTREAGIVRVFRATSEGGRPAAGLVVGHDSKRAYFMLAASHPDLRHTDAVTLLWWSVIQMYASTHNEIDLVGLGTPGIARFKKSFSPSYVPCDNVIRQNLKARCALGVATIIRSIGKQSG